MFYAKDTFQYPVCCIDWLHVTTSWYSDWNQCGTAFVSLSHLSCSFDGPHTRHESFDSLSTRTQHSLMVASHLILTISLERKCANPRRSSWVTWRDGGTQSSGRYLCLSAAAAARNSSASSTVSK
jgi:hypothetical protein